MLSALTVACSSSETEEDDTSSALAERVRPYTTSSVTCTVGATLAATALSPLTRLRVGPGTADIGKPVLRPFFSDGCSVVDTLPPFRSETFQSCCIAHDTKYWLGGTEDDKRAADDALEACIAAKGEPSTARVFAAAVRTFGGPHTSKLYRWGYGWNVDRGYEPVSSEGERQAKAMYGATGAALRQKLVDSTEKLEAVCNPDDRSLKELSASEKTVYDILKAKLRKQDTVEWARRGYFNQEHELVEVKLSQCATAVVIKLALDGSLLSFDTNCQ